MNSFTRTTAVTHTTFKVAVPGTAAAECIFAKTPGGDITLTSYQHHLNLSPDIAARLSEWISNPPPRPIEPGDQVKFTGTYSTSGIFEVLHVHGDYAWVFGLASISGSIVHTDRLEHV